MGTPKLWRIIKAIMRKGVHLPTIIQEIRAMRGGRVRILVDGHSWIHAAVLRCGEDFVLKADYKGYV
jgi:hypothetical protein